MCYTRHTAPKDNRLLSIDMVEVGSTEPVTLDEVKAHLRVTFQDDDLYLTMLIKSCRSSLEKHCAISMVPKDITVYADLYDSFELPYGPVIDEPTVMNGSDVVEATFFGSTFRKMVAFGTGLTITYSAGYEECPADLKLALLHEIAYQYENRGDSGKSELSATAKSLAKMHRRVPKVL